MIAPAFNSSAPRNEPPAQRLILPAHLRRRRGRPRSRPAKPAGRSPGGQPGNRNRWRHGAFSAAAQAQRDADKAQLRRMRLTIAETLAWQACANTAVIPG